MGKLKEPHKLQFGHPWYIQNKNYTQSEFINLLKFTNMFACCHRKIEKMIPAGVKSHRKLSDGYESLLDRWLLAKPACNDWKIKATYPHNMQSYKSIKMGLSAPHCCRLATKQYMISVDWRHNYLLTLGAEQKTLNKWLGETTITLDMFYGLLHSKRLFRNEHKNDCTLPYCFETNSKLLNVDLSKTWQ